MDPYLTVLVLVLVMMVWLQLSLMSFSYNFLASFIGTIIFLYFAVVARLLFPLEHVLLFYFSKGQRKGATDDRALSLTTKHNFDDEITHKMRELTGHIVRDFILEWYNTVSDDVHFVQEAFELFEHVFAASRQRVSKVDRQILLGSLLAFLSRHLSCYQQSLRYASSITKEPQRKQQLMILSYEKQLGHLAMSDLPRSEMDHLRAVTTILLKSLLPRGYHLTGTSLYLVRELIARNVLLPLIDMLSDPDWINGMVTYVLKEDNAGDDKSSTGGSGSSSDTEDLTEVAEHLQPPPVMTKNNSHSSHEQQNVDIAARGVRVSFSVASNMDELSLDVEYPDEQAALLDEQIATPFVSPRRHDAVANTSSIRHSNPMINDQVVSNTPVEDPLTGSSTLPLRPADSNGSSSALPTIREDAPSLDNNLPTVATIRPVNKRPGQLLKRVLDTAIVAAGRAWRRKERLVLQEGRFFQHVRIPVAVATEEAFEGGSKYTLYKIEYCAPCLSVQQRSKMPFQRQASSNNQEPFEEPSELQHYQVQRRFREFLTLQERLNERQLTRRLLRDVKAPSRMFMPIGNMDKDYIEKRRKFLQAYLRELCSFPTVCHSSDMKEFLAYNSDSRIAFVRKPSDYIPRFDKMLKSAVQDLLGSASVKLVNTFSRHDDVTTLGATEERRMSSDVKASKSMPILSSHHPSNNAPVEALSESPPLPAGPGKFTMMNPVARLKNIVLGKPTQSSLFEEGLRDYSAFSGPQNSNDLTFGRGWRDPLALLPDRANRHSLVGRRRQGDGSDVDMEIYEEQVISTGDQDLITGRVFRLIKQIWPVTSGANAMLYLTLARYVKAYIDINITSLTQQDKWLHYLKSLQDAMWPNGEWEKKDGDETKKSQLLKEEARGALEEAFPDALRYVVGNQGYERGVDDLLDSFQNPVINRHLVYHLVDVMARLLIPDLLTVIGHSNNVSL